MSSCLGTCVYKGTPTQGIFYVTVCSSHFNGFHPEFVVPTSYGLFCFYVDVFPSSLVEEQLLSCLSGTFTAMHASLGDMLFPNTTASNLTRQRVLFYTHKYIVPTNEQGYRQLQPLEAATLHSIEWPKPDAFTVMFLKAKIVADVRASLKFGKASRSVGLGWFCPAHVFASIFRCLPFHYTNTMFVCKACALRCLGSHPWREVRVFWRSSQRWSLSVSRWGFPHCYLFHQGTLYSLRAVLLWKMDVQTWWMDSIAIHWYCNWGIRHCNQITERGCWDRPSEQALDIGQCAGAPTSNGLRAWRSHKVSRRKT